MATSESAVLLTPATKVERLSVIAGLVLALLFWCPWRDSSGSMADGLAFLPLDKSLDTVFLIFLIPCAMLPARSEDFVDSSNITGWRYRWCYLECM